MIAPPEPSRRTFLLGSVIAAILCAAVLLTTSPGLPMAWDEGNAIDRAAGIPRWDWQYTTTLEGHPAFYGIVIAVGQWFSSWWLSPLGAARFGPMMLFSLAAGAMFYRMWRQYSFAAALGAAAALLLLPRMFAHAHFAAADGPLVSCWILAWAAFAPARRGWPQAVLWGIALGMTLSCKATGWLAPLPFIIHAAVYLDRPAAKALAIGLPVAVLTFLLLNPPLWQDPIHGTAMFFNLNLNRAANPQFRLNIPILFLGELHHLGNPLPWYNTLFWTAVTVPVGMLLLLAVGVAAALRRCRTESVGILLVLNWLVLLVVRAVPGAPVHDGVRLFLPSFAFLAALAGVGCAQVISLAARAWSRRLAAAGVVLIYATSAVNLFVYAPQWLSYYNLLIGGLPGATAAGMEPTYWWDGLDRRVLDWLHENTARHQKIRFNSYLQDNLTLMRRWETLRPATGGDAPGEYRWYVLQHRPSGYSAADRWLIEHVEPAYRKTLLCVPLVEVYDYADYRRADKSAR